MLKLSDKNSRYLVSFLMVLLLSIYRAVYTGALSPVLAIALFGGALFKKQFHSYFLPILPIIIGDIAFSILNPQYTLFGVIGTTITVYLTIALIVFLVKKFVKQISLISIGLGALLSPVLFYLITNFFVWIDLGRYNLYAKTVAGLGQCYSMGLPFLFKDILATMLFSGILFGAYSLFSSKVLKSELVRI